MLYTTTCMGIKRFYKRKRTIKQVKCEVNNWMEYLIFFSQFIFASQSQNDLKCIYYQIMSEDDKAIFRNKSTNKQLYNIFVYVLKEFSLFTYQVFYITALSSEKRRYSVQNASGSGGQFVLLVNLFFFLFIRYLKSLITH